MVEANESCFFCEGKKYQSRFYLSEYSPLQSGGFRNSFIRKVLGTLASNAAKFDSDSSGHTDKSGSLLYMYDLSGA